MPSHKQERWVGYEGQQVSSGLQTLKESELSEGRVQGRDPVHRPQHPGSAPTIHPWLVLLSQESSSIPQLETNHDGFRNTHSYIHPPNVTWTCTLYPACAKPQGNNKNKTHAAAARTKPAFQGQKGPEPSRAMGRSGQRREGAEGILMERDGVATPKQIR